MWKLILSPPQMIYLVDDHVLFPLMTRLWFWARQRHQSRMAQWSYAFLAMATLRVVAVVRFLCRLLAYRFDGNPWRYWQLRLLTTVDPWTASSSELRSLPQLVPELPNALVPSLVAAYERLQLLKMFKEDVRQDTQSQDNYHHYLKQIWGALFPNGPKCPPIPRSLTSVDLRSEDDEETQIFLDLFSDSEKDTDDGVCKASGSWEDLGFQGRDPQTDLRGMGVRSLKTLAYVASEYPELVHQALRTTYGVSYACIVINCVDHVVRDLLFAHLLDRFLLFADLAASKKTDLSGTAGFERRFNEAIVQLLCLVHAEWLRRQPDDIMAFPAIFATCKRQLRTCLYIL
jgi:hypothetical protein